MNVHIGVGKAAICISHRMPVPAFRIAVFTHGRIAEYGSYCGMDGADRHRCHVFLHTG